MSYFGENNFSESPGFERSYDLIRRKSDRCKSTLWVCPLAKLIKILIDSNFYTQSCNINIYIYLYFNKANVSANSFLMQVHFSWNHSTFRGSSKSYRSLLIFLGIGSKRRHQLKKKKLNQNFLWIDGRFFKHCVEWRDWSMCFEICAAKLCRSNDFLTKPWTLDLGP